MAVKLVEVLLGLRDEASARAADAVRKVEATVRGAGATSSGFGGGAPGLLSAGGSVGTLGKLALGGGAIAGLTFVARAAEAAAEGLNKGTQAWAAARAEGLSLADTWGQAGAEVLKSLPVFKQLYGIVDNLTGAFDFFGAALGFWGKSLNQQQAEAAHREKEGAERLARSNADKKARDEQYEQERIARDAGAAFARSQFEARASIASMLRNANRDAVESPFAAGLRGATQPARDAAIAAHDAFSRGLIPLQEFLRLLQEADKAGAALEARFRGDLFREQAKTFMDNAITQAREALESFRSRELAKIAEIGSFGTGAVVAGGFSGPDITDRFRGAAAMDEANQARVIADRLEAQRRIQDSMLDRLTKILGVLDRTRINDPIGAALIGLPDVRF